MYMYMHVIRFPFPKYLNDLKCLLARNINSGFQSFFFPEKCIVAKY